MAEGLYAKLALNGRVLRNGHQLLCQKGGEGWRRGTVQIQQHKGFEWVTLDLGGETVDLSNPPFRLSVVWTEAQARREDRELWVRQQTRQMILTQPDLLASAAKAPAGSSPMWFIQLQLPATRFVLSGEAEGLDPEVRDWLEKTMRRLRRQWGRKHPRKVQQAA